MMQLQELLKERNVQVVDIKLYLTCLQGTDKALTPDMRRAKNIPSFMQSFSRTYSWWNTRVSSSIACFFGGDAGIKLVEGYEGKLKGHFSRRITLKLPVVGRANEIVVKINHDYRSYSKENIEEFRHTISRLLKIEPWQFIFVNVEQGCVKLTFLISSIYIRRINDIASEIKKLDVISLSIDG